MKDALLKIKEMLEEGTPEQRVAACQVLAYLKPKTPQVVKALGAIAGEGETYLRRYAVDALGAIGNAAAHAFLIPILHDDGELRSRVIRVFARAGTSIETILVKEYAKADFETRVVILEALAMSRGKEAMALLLEVLKDADNPELARRAARFLLAEVEHLSGESNAKSNGEGGDEARDRLRETLRDALKSLPRTDPSDCRRFLIELLARLPDPALRQLFVSHASPTHAPEVRRAALIGLKHMDLTPKQIKDLLGYVGEDDFVNVVGPVLELLDSLEPSGAAMARLLTKLLENPRPEVRLFAIRGLGHYPTAAVAKQLIPFLESPDQRVRDMASESLGKNPEAREGITKLFLAGRDLDEASRPLKAMLLLAPTLTQGQLRKIVQGYVRLLGAEDPVRELYQRVLNTADIEVVGPLMLAEGKKLRTEGNFHEALRVLLSVSGASKGAVEFDARYELAVTTLQMRSPHHPDASEGDPVIGHFCYVLKHGFKVFDRIKKERGLTTDDLLYLGDRFVERLNEEKAFGSELLAYLIKREPEAKASIQAMQKLKVEGLA